LAHADELQPIVGLRVLESLDNEIAPNEFGEEGQEGQWQQRDTHVPSITTGHLNTDRS
jgi:hypothetical protein